MTPDDPRMRNVDDGLAQFGYSIGQDGLKIAEDAIAAEIFAYVSVRDGRAQDPRTFPGYPQDATPNTTARSIVARLLDAGWRPPDTECLDLPDEAS